VPSPGVPPKTDPDIREGVPSPLGDTDREPVGVDVDANKDETEEFEARYGRVDTEDVRVSVDALIFGNLREAVPEGGSGGSKGEALLRGVMKTSTGMLQGVRSVRFVAQWPGACAATCAWIETEQPDRTGYPLQLL